ncbi:hypothetical protein K505DRAFT_232559 [Melanomma pulvis-pyrius CBS 109.77]|uniref:DUF3253 domain-containing protein n=1 Tax=Melanomma pulvis-pyrius CBS 109.77 TaxID=1314802 RepID=A0A6A6XRY3_9PLEO|nr:hypothetical protein K505DRAFT_232559 [Melanomma pulvis-pyrius CBS 109.77]
MPLTDPQRPIVLAHTQRLLSTRDYPKTICPSEVARAFSAAELQMLNARSWRDAMEHVREVLWELREEGKVEILQRGEVLGDDVGLGDVRGPIRVRGKKED